jgi:hypothetical protein
MTFIKVVETSRYYVLSYMKGNSLSHKLRYEENLKLICNCLSDDMYTELIRLRISYVDITCIY